MEAALTGMTGFEKVWPVWRQLKGARYFFQTPEWVSRFGRIHEGIAWGALVDGAQPLAV